jgi:hypothetical protein
VGVTWQHMSRSVSKRARAASLPAVRPPRLRASLGRAGRREQVELYYSYSR